MRVSCRFKSALSALCSSADHRFPPKAGRVERWTLKPLSCLAKLSKEPSHSRNFESRAPPSSVRNESFLVASRRREC
ncbi:MAG: hypothetical protein ACK55I_35230, partial [bacterium]